MNVKSETEARTERPPPQVPYTAVISGISPLQSLAFFTMAATASRASTDSVRRIPVESRRPMTGAPTFRAIS